MTYIYRPFFTWYCFSLQTFFRRIVFKFAKLEILYLDDNKLSDAQDFASLGTLPRYVCFCEIIFVFT